MTRRSENPFVSVRTEGGLLPPEVLQRIAEASEGTLDGLAPSSYHLQKGERLKEAISRSWSRLTGSWAAFKSAREKLPESEAGTTLTRERWLLPLFVELGYGRLPASRGVEAGGMPFPVSHVWQNSPIHLVSFRVDIDKKLQGAAGTTRSSPHSLVQQLLNRSDLHLWGFVSNGLLLRLLRDNASLSRQAFVEFDLGSMMEEERFSDFCLLWLLCHQTRVEAEKPEECWLEVWTKVAREEGRRALDGLRDGVEKAIEILGAGFLSHPGNTGLREALRNGSLGKDDYYRQLLRLVYRLLFLLVAEDRELLLLPQASPLARERYQRFYSLARLRRLAGSRRGSRHVDLWRQLVLVMKMLGSDEGCPSLGLPPLGGFLFSTEAVGLVASSDVSNSDLLEALRKIALTEDGDWLRPVDFRNLGAEELGSVYESLLELHPVVDSVAGTFELKSAAGSERKATGSYYTPTSLIECLLGTALDPVLAEAEKKPDPEKAILALKICDPACGSGHFLIAAAHRMAKRLAAIRTGEDEPAPSATRTALRDVIGHCLFGVDINPMAAELCRVALWIESLEPGKPLTFLDHHIQVGNSLLGTTPELLEKGIPDEAFTPIEGDDRKACSDWKKQNKKERESRSLFEDFPEALEAVRKLSEARAALDAAPDVDLAGVHEKEKRWRRLLESPEYTASRLVADAWCAAFVWKKEALSRPASSGRGEGGLPPVTEATLRQLRKDPNLVPMVIRAEIARLSAKYQFLHWHLAYPEVFVGKGSGQEKGGFDVVLGNPPWERVKLQEEEFFAERSPEIANAANAAERKRLIDRLKKGNPALDEVFREAKRRAEGESQFLRLSGRYPLCGRGDVNTYSVFAELNRSLMGPAGYVGCIVPSGIATDDTTKFFFQEIATGDQLASLYDFQSGGELFGEIGHARFKFCLLTLRASLPGPPSHGSPRPLSGEGGAERRERASSFAFFLRSVSDLDDPERTFNLTPEEINLLNPNTGTCPIFRSRRDAEITKAIYKRVPVLINEKKGDEGNPWGISFMAMFHMSSDSGIFCQRAQLEAEGYVLRGNVFVRGESPKQDVEFVPLYEAKMVHHFDHRFGDYAMKPDGSEGTALPDVPVERLQDPDYAPIPRYWVTEAEVEGRLKGRWEREWLLGWRDITNATNERTVIAGIVPRVGVGNKIPLIFLSMGVPPDCVYANLSSFACDYASRQKLGGATLNYFIFKQLPILPPSTYSAPTPWSASEPLSTWLTPRVLELTFTAWDLAPFARDLGYPGPPFRWEPERRFQIRCELDAAFFHLYGIGRDDVDYILDTFPIVRRNDEKANGEYRTKRVILERYDEMQRAIDTGKALQTRLDPPPGDPAAGHVGEQPA